MRWNESFFSRSIFVCTVLAFFVPLVVLPSSFIFPFIVPKILLFRTLVLIMVAAYGLLLLSNWETYRPRVTLLNGIVLLFWLSFTISTFVGVDWYRSFWDNHERMLGLFTVTHYVLFYVILSATLQQREQWDRLIKWFMVGASLVILVGVVQKINPEFLLNRGSARVSATLGNAIYLSGYGLFLLFLSLLSYIRTPASEQSWRYVAIAAAVLGFFGIFLGGTRGTFLGLVASSAVLLICFAALTTHAKSRRIAIGLMVLGVCLAGGLFVFRSTPVVQSIPAVGRLAKIDYTSLGENTRIMAWGIAWDSFLDKPVFGWGPNNFYYAFNQYYRGEFLGYGYGETWFDNAHNIIMNTISTQGAFGIVVYLGVFILAIWQLFSARRRGQLTNAECSVLVAFLVGHFVHNIFVFENPTSYLYFFFALAYIQVRTVRPSDTPSEGERRQLSTPMVGGAAVLCVFAIYIFNINPAQANTATLHTIQQVYQGNGVAAYKQASTIPTPHIDDVRNDFSRTVTQVVPQLLQAGETDLATKYVEFAIKELEKNLVLHPLDIRSHLMLSQLLQQRAVLEQNGTYLGRAIKLLTEAQVYSPERQQIMFTLGHFYSMVGDTKQATAQFDRAREVDPTVGEAWTQQIEYYRNSGRVTTSLELAAEVLEDDRIKVRASQRKVLTSLIAQYAATTSEAIVEE